jgi:hypothetical protein
MRSVSSSGSFEVSDIQIQILALHRLGKEALTLKLHMDYRAGSSYHVEDIPNPTNQSWEAKQSDL